MFWIFPALSDHRPNFGQSKINRKIPGLIIVKSKLDSRILKALNFIIISQNIYHDVYISGVPQVVLLTKIDKICEPLTSDVSNVFYMPVIQEYVDKVSTIMGLPRAHVLPVKNYESEMELDEGVNILALLTMQQILHFADDFLYNFLDDLEDEDNSREWKTLLVSVLGH